MKKSKELSNKDSGKLESYSQVASFNRLSDRDVETSSSSIAGGDAAALKEGIEDKSRFL